MKIKLWLFTAYGCILAGFLVIAFLFDDAVTVFSEDTPPTRNSCIIIDPGHGGPDGGATSRNGIPESKLNLEISVRLNDLLHLLGMDTLMIRTEDISIYTEGQSIAAKKVSDLKDRVRIVNNTENALLVSIHQNHFYDSKYSGAQVFYGKEPTGRQLAERLQSVFIKTLNPDSKRQAKPANGIYLMQKVTCPAILIECGFISNYEEEAKLCDPSYQKNLCSVIATVLSGYANT